MSAESRTPMSRDSLRARAERAISPGLGTCYRCRRPWKFPATRRDGPNVTRQLSRDRFWGTVGVEEHSTNYRDGRGCFPLCEGCWSQLAPDERLPYYRRLWDRWLTDAIDDPISARGDERINELHEDWRGIESAVLGGL